MPAMPYTHAWQKHLAKSHGIRQARAIIAKTQIFYDDYYAMHSGETNQANRALLRTRLLPGLALYRALIEAGNDRQKALRKMDGLFRATFFTRMAPGLRLLSYLPDPFPMVKPVLKMMTQQKYLPGSQEVVEDSPDCFALTVYRCFTFDTLTTHGASELTVIYCNTDDWLADLMPKIRWERTKTLGRGGDCCDFKWCRIKPSDSTKDRYVPVAVSNEKNKE